MLSLRRHAYPVTGNAGLDKFLAFSQRKQKITEKSDTVHLLTEYVVL
jgi:hypothetical protein